MNVAVEAESHEAGRAQRARQALDKFDLWTIGRTVLIATALTLATIVAFTELPRYHLPGQPILENADFKDGFNGWRIQGLVSLDETELGLAILQNPDPRKAAYLRQTLSLPPGRTSVQVSADLAASQIRRGDEPWQTALVYLVQQAPNDEYLWNQPFRVTNLVGTTSRQHFSKIFEIPGTVSRAMLGIELPYATGRLEVANLRVAVLDELPGFRLVATLLVCGWSLLAFWVVLRVYRGIHSSAVRGWLLVTVALLGGGVFMPSVIRQEIIDQLASGFGFQLPEPDAFAHALLFGLLAFLIRVGRPNDPILLHISCWLLLGAVTEVLQLFTPDRDAEAGDWLMDALGASIGLGLAEAGRRLQQLLDATKARAKPPPP